MGNRSERVKSSLKAMGEATAQQVHDAIGEEDAAYTVREVANRLDELVLNEPDEFGKVGDVYGWAVYYRFKTGLVRNLRKQPMLVVVNGMSDADRSY